MAELEPNIQEWIDLYHEGKIDAWRLQSELEFDGFDGDIIEFL